MPLLQMAVLVVVVVEEIGPLFVRMGDCFAVVQNIAFDVFFGTSFICKRIHRTSPAKLKVVSWHLRQTMAIVTRKAIN